jgi:hypothetical protein
VGAQALSKNPKEMATKAGKAGSSSAGSGDGSSTTLSKTEADLVGLIKKTIDEELDRRNKSAFVFKESEILSRSKKELRKHAVKLNSDIEKYTPKGKKLRKAFERPRPDLPSDAPENRTRKIVSVTLPPELLDDVNQRCRDLEVDRSSLVEAALRAFLTPSP